MRPESVVQALISLSIKRYQLPGGKWVSKLPSPLIVHLRKCPTSHPRQHNNTSGAFDHELANLVLISV